MTTAELLSEIRECLQAAYGSRLRGIVLYGSEARGEAGPESDIDLLILLEDPVDLAKDLQTNLDVLYPLSMKIGRRISAKPVSARQYETVDCPLYRQAQSEGIAEEILEAAGIVGYDPRRNSHRHRAGDDCATGPEGPNLSSRTV